MSNKVQSYKLFSFSKKDVIFIKHCKASQYLVSVIGPMGSVSRFLNYNTSFYIVNSHQCSIFFSEKKQYWSFIGFLNATFWGLVRGFYFEFIIRGIGYKYKFFRKNENYSLLFKLGYGHKVYFTLSNLIQFNNNKRFDFLVSGFDKGLVKNFAESVRLIRETDSYKGKGIKYYRVPLKLKVGKVR